MDLVREFVRGAVQLHVMHHAHEGEVHGTALIEELALHGHALSPGTLYPMLHRLEDAGLVISRDALVAGRHRRLYRTTPAGDRAFRECQRALRELADELLDT
ncbi:MAG: PadR family transcriptional regulator [Acidimicrobiales bacterium]